MSFVLFYIERIYKYSIKFTAVRLWGLERSYSFTKKENNWAIISGDTKSTAESLQVDWVLLFQID